MQQGALLAVTNNTVFVQGCCDVSGLDTAGELMVLQALQDHGGGT